MNEEVKDNSSEISEEEVQVSPEENESKEAVDQENSAVETEEQEEEDEEVDMAAELSEAKDKYLRLYSEFENFRRRTSKEKLDLINSASKDLMVELIPVVDDFERAMKSLEGADEENEAVKGITLISNKFKKVLEEKGLKVMEIKQGDDFDEEFHEAITQIPAPTKKLEGKIVDVIEKGYFLKEKVIRFAKVVTGAKK